MTQLTSKNINVRIASAGKEVISTGTVNVFDQKDLQFTFDDMKIVMEFIDDKGEQKLNGEAIEEKTLKLTLHNFNNSLGVGTTKPLVIGSINSKKLYMSFVVYSLSSDSLKTVHYTFYLGEEVDG